MPNGNESWADESGHITIRKHSVYDGHIMVPMRLVEECPARKGALYAYCVLCVTANGRGTDWPSIGEMARQCHMKPDDLRAALRWLCEQGWVTREDRPGSASIFRV